ncbi:hypothetical protein [Vitiosangium sp. GDMCC 1.1324]|uniref:hypothetical protein n=1 Tax=Vitiosangium sp. (strain GDMCC 1.1324) TaxID=2138576 RepID=UPI000D38C557|nr:hypothetical protein [Vitiosangium sp. GDMCC 1.1324]PTL80334.1 hypothetical protein DAT35_30600 [Vitiosangium sp. GDMCC 1.1324]
MARSTRAHVWLSTAAFTFAALLFPSPSFAQQGPCPEGQVYSASSNQCFHFETSAPLPPQEAEKQCASKGMTFANTLKLTGVSEIKSAVHGREFVTAVPMERNTYEVVSNLDGWVTRKRPWKSGDSHAYVCLKQAPVACKSDEVSDGATNCLYVFSPQQAVGEEAKKLCQSRKMNLISSVVLLPTIATAPAVRAYINPKLGTQPFVTTEVSGGFSIWQFTTLDALPKVSELKKGSEAATVAARVICVVKASERAP